MNRSSYSIAQERVDIADVCNLIGMDVAVGGVTSGGKYYCPFCADRAFRIYGGNTAHCFACGLTWGPVSLYAAYANLNWQDAADSLLEHFGIPRETPDDRWKDLTRPQTFQVNTSDLAESLRMFCVRIEPNWEEKQFDPDVSSTYTACLGLLTQISSVRDIERWREATKKIMRKALGHGEEN